jgi:hypothetical protein
MTDGEEEESEALSSAEAEAEAEAEQEDMPLAPLLTPQQPLHPRQQWQLWNVQFASPGGCATF